MMEYGWRTVVIQSPSRLIIKEGQMSVYDVVTKEEHLIPIEEVRRIIVSVPSGIISFGLLQKLIEANVSVVLCDRKRVPGGEIIPLGQREESSGCIMDQACWTQERKDIIWSEIVRQKIRNQINALEICRKTVPHCLEDYLDTIEGGDLTNREAMAAKVYFHALFGMSFVRHSRDPRNAALNYGYSLICSTVARTVSIHGYHTALGIHHQSRNNRLNLACDIMEPFRPFIDIVVAKQEKRYLDSAFKADLIQSLQNECVVDGMKYTIEDAIEAYGLKVLKALGNDKMSMPKVEYEQ